MHVSFGKTAYVAGTSDEILDKLESSKISITTSDDGLVIVTKEEVDSFIQKYETELSDYDKLINKTLYTFIKESLQAIEDKNIDKAPIGNIFFVS
jgi:hypothetical protein